MAYYTIIQFERGQGIMRTISKTFLLSMLVLSASFSTSLSASCRIKIVVPENGSVHAVSGAHSCEAGLTCEIETADTDCDETFLASPDFGYKFVGWRKAPRALCDENSAAACLVKSSISTDHLSMANSGGKTEAFSLEPIFVADGTNAKPEKIGLLCKVDQCSVDTLGGREVDYNNTDMCADVLESTSTISLTGAKNKLHIRALSNKAAVGAYEPLPSPAQGWKFVGHIGVPATAEGIALIVQVNEDQRLCTIRYVEGANTSDQVTLTLNGSIEE